MVVVTDVRFEHHGSNAIGIGEPSPRISWSFSGDDENWTQQNYEIEIRRFGEENDAPRFYPFDSSTSCYVSWPGTALKSGEKAAVRVRVTGKDGKQTEWSAPSTVEAGILSKEEWAASVIERPTDVTENSHEPVVFRRTFEIPGVVSTARLYATAHGIYAAMLNGKPVGDEVLAPGWSSYKHRLLYQTFDITSSLRAGTNVLDVTVAEGWYSGRLGSDEANNNLYGSELGFIAVLTCQLEGGTICTIGTDDDWKWTHGPFLSAGIYDGVAYDANRSISDTTKWGNVISKPIHDNVEAPIGPPIRRKHEIEPTAIIVTPSGKTIFDMGQNMVGWIRVRVDGPVGTRITFRFAEVLEHGELGTRPLRTAKATDVLTLGGDGPLEWEPLLTFHGFRYVEVAGWPGEVSKADITGIVIYSDMRQTASFHCSNAMLNKLHENVVWGTRGNFVGLPTDCPQRDERLGWTGDIAVFGDTANYLYDTAGLLASWLMDLRLEQRTVHGIVPLVIPNIWAKWEKDAHAIWGDVAVILPWSLFRAFGDHALLARQYETMKAWINAIPRHANGLWDYQAEWKLGDWLDPAAPPDDPGNARTDPTHVSDAFLVHVYDLMARAATQLGKTTDAEIYTADATSLRKAYAEEYITPAGLLADNTQTAYALALHFGLFPTAAQKARAAERLRYLVQRGSRFKIATGFAGTPFVGYALTQTGSANIFYRMLLCTDCPSWLYPVRMGATTIWERWDSMLPDGRINPGKMTSFNHYALGAVAGWMYCRLVGLAAEEAGWRTFCVEPVPGGGLMWAEGEHVSAYGRHVVRWRMLEGKKFRLEVEVPPNTRAVVFMPGQRRKGHGPTAEVGSGKYSWEDNYVPEEAWPPEAQIAPHTDEGSGVLHYFDEALPCPWA